jgi:hypothetical protein
MFTSLASPLVAEQKDITDKALAATVAATRGILKEIEDPGRDLHHHGVRRSASQCLVLLNQRGPQESAHDLRLPHAWRTPELAQIDII